MNAPQTTSKATFKAAPKATSQHRFHSLLGKITLRTGLIAIALGMFGFMLMSNLGAPRLRMDLTEEKLHSLSPESISIIQGIEHPIKLYLFRSLDGIRSTPGFDVFSNRVTDLIASYVRRGSEKIELIEVDPKPFSQDEDLAAEFNMRPLRLGDSTTEIFFGLGAEMQIEEQVKRSSIPFFHPDQEATLEYQISKLIYDLGRSKQPTITLLTGMRLLGGQSPSNLQGEESQIALTQLRERYRFFSATPADPTIREDTDLLIVVQPQRMNQKALYAVDQHILKGGTTLIMLDPNAEFLTQWAPHLPDNIKYQQMFRNWGIEMPSHLIVGDLPHALSVSTTDNRSMTHPAIIAVNQAHFTSDDAVTSSVDRLHIATAGALRILNDDSGDAAEAPSQNQQAQTESDADDKDGGEADSNESSSEAEIQDPTSSEYAHLRALRQKLQITPIIQSSDQSALLTVEAVRELTKPEKVYQEYQGDGERYNLALLVRGIFPTAFPGGLSKKATSLDFTEADLDENEQQSQQSSDEEVDANHLEVGSEEANVIVISDIDMLSNRLWVNRRSFLGQSFNQPFADNGIFILNLVDRLLGNSALINMRGRGKINRPFEVVDTLRAESDSLFRAKEQQLVAELREIESELRQSLNQNADQSLEQQAENEQKIAEFTQKKLETRIALRDVRLQLNESINALGTRLKFINLVVAPLLLTLLVVFAARLILRRNKL